MREGLQLEVFDASNPRELDIALHALEENPLDALLVSPNVFYLSHMRFVLLARMRHRTTKNQLFAALDWLPTFVEIAGGPKGDGLKKQLESGKYPGIVKTTLDGVNQIDYLTGKSAKSAREFFFYFNGSQPAAVRYKNWKMYYNMPEDSAVAYLLPTIPFHFTIVDNIKRDPFEQAVGTNPKSAMYMGGSIASPSTAYQYDWNILPIGQQLWLGWFETLAAFPPMQAPASYNLTQVMEAIKSQKHGSAAGE